MILSPSKKLMFLESLLFQKHWLLIRHCFKSLSYCWCCMCSSYSTGSNETGFREPSNSVVFRVIQTVQKRLLIGSDNSAVESARYETLLSSFTSNTCTVCITRYSTSTTTGYYSVITFWTSKHQLTVAFTVDSLYCSDVFASQLQYQQPTPTKCFRK